MDSLSLFLSCFQVVSPKQWTTWVYPCFPKRISIPRFVGTRNIKFHSPVGRITEVYSNSVFSSVIHSVSGPEMSPIKCLFLQTISLQIHFKISQCPFMILFSCHSSSYYYQHGSRQSFSPVESPFLSRHFSEVKAIWLAFDSLICFTTEHLINLFKGVFWTFFPFSLKN